MEKEPKMGIDPKIKEEINKEGWENNAAVLIGKKEEMAQLLEKLETEGKTADLESYIRLHKEIALPQTEILDEELRKEISENKGSYSMSNLKYIRRGEFSSSIWYVDKDGNIVEVKILTEKIKELNKEMEEVANEDYYRQTDRLYGLLRNKLKELNFSSWTDFENQAEQERIAEIWKKITHVMDDYKERLERKAAEKKKEEFDF